MKAFTDDGRTVADMNVEGMPWFSPRREDGGENPPRGKTSALGAVLAAVAAAGVFIGAAALFLLFCVNVWLR